MSFAPQVALVSQTSGAAVSNGRPEVRGKFLFLGEEKLYVKGITYGTFRPNRDGNEFHDPDRVGEDFRHMITVGINTVRVYTVPPRWFLDLAADHGLFVMVGLPWEQHVMFLDDAKMVSSIEQRVRAGIRSCRNHPTLLCYAIGNEIPASIVRWYGAEKIQRYLHRLYDVAKEEDPGGLVTYVNFPTTEYLELPFLDLVCFNVYLESQERLATYLARLQNLAGDRPLIMAEMGLDSRRNGKVRQAETLDWQIRSCFAAGCGGVIVFSWTDEWHRGGHDVDDWDFGLTTRDRRPKPALAAVGKAYSEVPFPAGAHWPRFSVVVCSYNGARTIGETLEGLQNLRYPDYEVIVVDDGSIDSTAEIAGQFDVRLISVTNGGLSRARNLGLQAATGDLVAYIDDDAYPDPDWLQYLGYTFRTNGVAAVGGPNIPPPGDGRFAACVAEAPGGPTHVLLSDSEAEHIPGCNMSFRKDHLEAAGGFDPEFRVAGDDVDLCWRLQQRGWKLGFHPAAVVWHHRRNSLRAYWRQQIAYGKAEALLERKWPEKYNITGQAGWAGRLYGKGLPRALGLRARIYHGIWGSAPFQSLYHPVKGTVQCLPMMPEWYLVLALLALLSLLGLSWAPMLLASVFLAVGVSVTIAQAWISAASPSSADIRVKTIVAFLHMSQPVARLLGRLRYGLAPWRLRGQRGLVLPYPKMRALWSTRWRSAEDRLALMESGLREAGVAVQRGGGFDRFEMEVRAGLLGGARFRMALEEHGSGQQLVRFRVWPRLSWALVAPVLIAGCLTVLAVADGARSSAVVLGLLTGLVALRIFQECGTAMGAVWSSITAQCESMDGVQATRGDSSGERD